jgi:hypothetical protein
MQLLYLADLYNKDTDPHDFRVLAGFWLNPVNNLINLCSFEVTSLAAFVDFVASGTYTLYTRRLTR